MKEISSFLIENTIEFKQIMSNLPIPIIKDWINSYKTSGTKQNFEDWQYDNAWMMVDSSYTKIKNYSVFVLDHNSNLSIFSNQETIGYEVNSKFALDYFKPIFESVFFDDRGNINEKSLKDWAKSYNSLGRREFYMNLVEKIDMFDKDEFISILHGLFIQSLGVTIENYFDLTDNTPMSMEDAEFMVMGFIDCSDPNLALREKWKYLEQHGKYLNAEVYKRTLYYMLKDKSLSDQRRIIQMLSGMKNKKLRLGVIQEKLNSDNQHRFCSCWQKVTGV